jgi:hypothetical protein
MPPAEFEYAVSESERPQTHALDRPATGGGCVNKYIRIFLFIVSRNL